jgi:hypothetical protein
MDAKKVERFISQRCLGYDSNWRAIYKHTIKFQDGSIGTRYSVERFGHTGRLQKTKPTITHSA